MSHDEVLRTENVWIRYGAKAAIQDVSMSVPKGQVTAFIGPSGCGKSTLLRAFNRMNDTIPGASQDGRILLHGDDIRAPDTDVPALRRRIGMLFQKPNPFPLTIFDNVAYGLRLGARHAASELKDRVERSLRDAALWDEVSDRLDDPALGLSGGQQQRLCLARALAVEPEVLLMDEPTSALDPIATAHVEDLVRSLRGDYTVVIVTHNMQQARRLADRTAVFYLGRLLEHGETSQVFDDPHDEQVRAYVRGDFG